MTEQITIWIISIICLLGILSIPYYIYYPRLEWNKQHIILYYNVHYINKTIRKEWIIWMKSTV